MQGAEGFPLKTDALGGRGKPQRGRRVWTLTSRNPAASRAASRTPGALRLNGPGWPGPGGANCARSRMIDTGIEKNSLRSAVEKAIAASRPPSRSNPAHASEGQVPVGEVHEAEPGDHRVECALSQGAEGLAVGLQRFHVSQPGP